MKTTTNNSYKFVVSRDEISQMSNRDISGKKIIYYKEFVKGDEENAHIEIIDEFYVGEEK